MSIEVINADQLANILHPQGTNSKEQQVNFVYHLYANIFEEMNLQDVDHRIYLFIPRSIWDNECSHYHQCMHNLAWNQYCCAFMEHIVQAANQYFPHDKDMTEMDILDVMIWSCYNSNAIDVLTGLYAKLNLEDLIQATGEYHTTVHDSFIKYLQVKTDETKRR